MKRKNIESKRGLTPFPRAFTLTELLITIGIIALLISITIPVISKVRKQAQAAGVQNQIQSLGAQIQAYQQSFGAYPGPLSDDQVYCEPNQYPPVSGRDVLPTSLGVKTASTDFAITPPLNPKYVSGSENLVLGLLGGLRLDGTSAPYTIVYDPALVGNGPMNLNPSQVKKFNPYGDAKNLSWRTDTVTGKRTGEYQDGGGDARDTMIPEFVDQFTNPMPILYLRARKGVEGVIRNYTGTANNAPLQQYDLKDIIGYTGPPGITQFIGEGKSFAIKDVRPPQTSGSVIPHGLRTVQGPYNGSSSTGTVSSLDKAPPSGRTYIYPFDAYAYFEDPSNRYSLSPSKAGQARAKDSFILISAGPDRVYGTLDDICSFGAVVP